jgi:ABC-type dipeptide/oligopeptide/nickel transport system permease component
LACCDHARAHHRRADRIISAIRQDTWIDYVLRVVTVLGVAVPSFYLGTLLLLFATKLSAGHRR